jgi:ABC-type uncharacterized transport system permease subunit
MTTDPPPAAAPDRTGRWQPFRSLSRAMLRGFVRDRAALFFSLLFPVIFLAIATTPYFGLQLTSYWWMAIPVVICGTLAFLSIGLLVGAVAKTQQAATAMANLVILPMAFLGGAFIPLTFAPHWIQQVSYLMPLRYLVVGHAERDVPGRRPGLGAARDGHPARLRRRAHPDRGAGIPLG